jgi:hypothetical protein
LRRVTALKSSFFSKSTCLVAGKNWPLSAYGLLIQVAILLLVKTLKFGFFLLSFAFHYALMLYSF